MPVRWFRCPDKVAIAIEACLKPGGCRLEGRCNSIRNLWRMTIERKWTGFPSTTQLLRGTREAYLSLLVPYVINPDGEMYKILGTRTHAGLERSKYGDFVYLQEVPMRGDICTGILDFWYQDGDVAILEDTKVSGSFKIAKAMGIETELVPHPTEKYRKSGHWGKAGSPKMVKVPVIRPEKADHWDWSMQVNLYRIMAEKGNWVFPDEIPETLRNGVKVDKMEISAVVRDGSTAVAEGRGVIGNHYIVDIPFLPDAEVVGYFREKAQHLAAAIRDRKIPDQCSSTETWDGRKCQERYCYVFHACREVVDHGGCKEHPSYQGLRRPRLRCRGCWEWYWIKHNKIGR